MPYRINSGFKGDGYSSVKDFNLSDERVSTYFGGGNTDSDRGPLCTVVLLKYDIEVFIAGEKFPEARACQSPTAILLLALSILMSIEGDEMCVIFTRLQTKAFQDGKKARQNEVRATLEGLLV